MQIDRGKGEKRTFIETSAGTGNIFLDIGAWCGMHTWYHIAVRRGVKEHTRARFGLAYQVHVRVLVVVQGVGSGWWRRLGRGDEVILGVKIIKLTTLVICKISKKIFMLARFS